MEELKSCLFCGRYIDTTFRYCPYCGYEFGQRDEFADLAEETSGESCLYSEASAMESPDGIPVFGAGNPDEGPQTDLGQKTGSESPKEPVLAYLSRLSDMKRLLCEMERELDLIISRAGSARPPAAAPVKWPDLGPVTSSSKGP